jgi:hypothetical protein
VKYRPGAFRLLCIGLLLGLALAPLLWFSSARGTTAQALPFTPTPEPIDTATPVPPTDTATPTRTPQPVTATPDILPIPPPMPGAATSSSVPATASGPTSTPRPTATPLPPGFGRDLCDPNHQLTQPCALATETEIANLNFTDDPTDVFSFLLKGGRQYRISAIVGSAGGLDPLLDVFLAGQIEQPIASNDDARIGDPSAVVTVTVEADGWYLARVVNKAPGDPAGKTYSVSARSVAVASAAPFEATNPDDLIGNAYDVEHAVRLAWNVPYDMSMRCPEAWPGACYAGRHTFLLVPVKGAVPFTALTYDVGAGVDTVLTLYKLDPTQQSEGPGLIPGWRAVAGNDDIAPGWTLRSQITLTPDWNSIALLVVAPSERADLPPIPTDGRPGRYRLIVGSPELPNVKAAIEGQHDLPPTPVPPTPRPTGQAAPIAVSTQAAQDNREVIKEACPTGQAVIGDKGTDLYAAAPPAEGDKIASYPSGALVQLLGQCYRGWVKVQPQDSVTPGWMWAPNLRPETIEATPGPIGPTSASGTPGPRPSSTSMAGTQQPAPGGATPTPTVPLVAPVLVPLEPLPLPTAAAPKPVARAVTVEVCQAAQRGDACDMPLADLRVELLLAATRQILTGNLTDTSGRVTLSVSVPTGSQILLSIPALGLESVLGEKVTEVPVRVPKGEG